ncbi:hypothetical protein BC835DRAFT_1310543 [Cytidiella melzeri]|nr:hypothetical protein BC835DRAFT_1310543 [Cytidiella melzeri]
MSRLSKTTWSKTQSTNVRDKGCCEHDIIGWSLRLRALVGSGWCDPWICRIPHESQRFKLVYLKDTWRAISDDIHKELKTYMRLMKAGVPSIADAVGGGDSDWNAIGELPRLVMPSSIKAKVLHRGVSAVKILIDINPQDFQTCPKGSLNDWDLCQYGEDLNVQASQHGRSTYSQQLVRNLGIDVQLVPALESLQALISQFHHICYTHYYSTANFADLEASYGALPNAPLSLSGTNPGLTKMVFFDVDCDKPPDAQATSTLAASSTSPSPLADLTTMFDAFAAVLSHWAKHDDKIGDQFFGLPLSGSSEVVSHSTLSFSVTDSTGKTGAIIEAKRKFKSGSPRADKSKRTNTSRDEGQGSGQ